jgi:hypothetical protein
MRKSLFRPLLEKMRYAAWHPHYLWRRLVYEFCSIARYSSEHWARVVIYRELFAEIQRLVPRNLVALEISPGATLSPWRRLGFAEYLGVDYPEFDICSDTLEKQFDLIIADQVSSAETRGGPQIN